MNKVIRQWIEKNYQPWRASPHRSAFRGRIDDPNALPFTQHAADYYARRGIEIKGRLWEELLEDEIFECVKTVSSWLPNKHRIRFDDTVAFGMCRTNEPNACAMRCFDGYAVLFDNSLHNLLASTLELYLCLRMPPRTVERDSFPIAFNTIITSDFFHSTDPWSSLEWRPQVPEIHRRAIPHALWFLIVFLLSHEAGHVVLGHLKRAPVRDAMFRSNNEGGSAQVLNPAHDDEFAADKFAIELLWKGAKSGGLIKPGHDPVPVWQANYGELMWFFTVLGGIEILASRIGIPMSDGHPSAESRWRRIAPLITSRIELLPSEMLRDLEICALALDSARRGPLPQISDSQVRDTPEGAGIPLSLAQEQIERESEFPALEVVNAWFGAPTTEVAKEVLEMWPELYRGPYADLMHVGFAQTSDHEIIRHHILVTLRPLIQRCRAVGITQAFDEFERAPANWPPGLPFFEPPWRDLKTYMKVLRGGGNTEFITKLLESSPRLAAYVNLPHTVDMLLRAASSEELQLTLEKHPELFHPVAEKMLEERRDRGEAGAVDGITRALAILARTRDTGMLRTVEEAARKDDS